MPACAMHASGNMTRYGPATATVVSDDGMPRSAPMTTTTAKTKAAWRGAVGSIRRFYTTEEPAPSPEIDETAEDATARPGPPGTVEVVHGVLRCVVRVSRVGCDPIDFPVNHRDGRNITFTDPRGRDAGTAGVTGLWGTRPAPPVHKPRPLSPTAFQLELARLIGAEPATEIVRTILAPDFFGAGVQPTGPRFRATKRPAHPKRRPKPGMAQAASFTGNISWPVE